MEVCTKEIIYLQDEFLSPELQQIKHHVQEFAESSEKEIFHKRNRDVIRLMLRKGIDVREHLRKEGYWCDAQEKKGLFKAYPFPKENSGNADDLQKFLSQLSRVEKSTPLQHYLGYSTCRICGNLNGTGEYHTARYVWPQGLRHYIEHHQVEPSPGFVLYIRQLCGDI